MTIKVRTIRSLRDARQRLRDAAAARHAQTAHVRALAVEQLERDHDTLDSFLDDAVHVLTAITAVHELDRIAASATELRLAVVDAAAAEAEASAQVDRSSRDLRDRARQLRSIERLAERVDRERAQLEAKSEQQSNDELAARRR